MPMLQRPHVHKAPVDPSPFREGLSELFDGLKILGTYFLWPVILVAWIALSLWPVWLVGGLAWFVYRLP